MRSLAASRNLAAHRTLAANRVLATARRGISLKDCLIAHWALDETSGVRIDPWGGNHLTDNNSVGSAAGIIGNAASFDPDLIQSLSSNSAALSDGRTFAAWIKLPSDVVLEGSYHFLSKWDSNFQEYNLGYKPGFTGLLGFDYGNAGVTVDASNFGVPPLDEWMLVIAWVDFETDRIAIQVNNTEPNFSTPGVSPGEPGALFTLGQLGENTGLYYGLLDEVAIFNAVFTQTERDRLWNAGAGLPLADY